MCKAWIHRFTSSFHIHHGFYRINVDPLEKIHIIFGGANISGRRIFELSNIDPAHQPWRRQLILIPILPWRSIFRRCIFQGDSKQISQQLGSIIMAAKRGVFMFCHP